MKHGIWKAGWGLAVAVAFIAGNAASAEKPIAKNVILFIGDGWSYSAVEAASYYHHGHAQGEHYQRWREFPMATYPHGSSYDPEAAWEDFNYVRRGATDSAAAGTALASGTLTRAGRIGVGPDDERLRLVTEAAHAIGKSTGSISDVPFHHATPAAFYAHVESRGMTAEISRQLFEESHLTVAMGAGHPYYDDDSQRRDEPGYDRVGGQELWHALAAGELGTDFNGDGTPNPWRLIETREEFEAIASGEVPAPERLIGVARVGSTLQYNRSGDKQAAAYAVPFNEEVPSLATMTQAAINVLSENENGFFLMVEAGAIDWAGHGNSAGRIIEEMTFLNEAVAAAIAWVEEHSNWDETLIVVTGDHDCGYLMGPWSDPGFQPVVNNGKGNMPGMRFYSTGHTNMLIPAYVRGPGIETLADRTGGVDPVRGPYIQIATLGGFLIEAVAGE